MDRTDKQQQQQLSLAKSARHRCSEWVFRDVPSDITIEVSGGNISLHKFPLVSRSGRIRRLVAEHRDSDISRVELLNLPGVLQQCESLLPLADELKVVSRCIDAIASKACAEQIASSFSRLEYSSSGRLHMSRQAKCDGDWWIGDLSVLRIDMYQRVITAMKFRGVRPESIGASLVNYAQKELTKKSSLWNPSSQTKVDSNSTVHEKHVVETIVSLLPVEKLVVPINFLFGLLRSAVMLDCSIASRLDLERKIGSQLDVATLDDLLIPSFRHAGDTLFDVDTVHRILAHQGLSDLDKKKLCKLIDFQKLSQEGGAHAAQMSAFLFNQ
ncbi:SKP1/BTB/POZ domain superfamily [Sesbania bispinosa]|nr:SKP1/BTB/POZ domain superfamily [Sesbania bispinosa]